MTLKGGASDKIGNRYEDYWTIRCMIRILNEYDKANYIYLENPEPDGEGVEFFIGCNGTKEFHQVKRQRSEGRWTPKSLRNVLMSFWSKLQDEHAICKFISTTSATELKNLTEHARSSSSYTQFKDKFLSSTVLKRSFRELCEIWDNSNPEDVYDAIKRVWFVPLDEIELRRFVTDYLGGHIKGDPDTVRSVLFEYVFGNVHKKLDANKIWNHLKNLNYQFYNWYKDSSVMGRIDDINENYERKRRSLVSHMIPQNSSMGIIDKIQANKDIIITGKAGVGKSTVILQTLDYLKNKDVPFIILDVDNLESASSAVELGEKLRLPGSPVDVLENIAQGENCVLIIDQLDNVSLVPATRPEFFYCIYEIIEKAKLIPNISLILACRQYDIDNDTRLIDLIKKFEIDKIELGNFSPEQVNDYITNLGLTYNDLSSNLEILSVPLNLRLLSEIIRSSGNINFSFDSPLDLFKQYWKTKKLNIKIGDSKDWNNVIDILCDHMVSNQVLYVDEELLDDYSEYAESMASEGVLILDSRKYSFFHRNFFEYAFARRFITNKKDIIKFVTNDEQHLSIRSQVRQILLYKRALNFNEYLRDIRSLLNNPEIRFHIKKIVFEILSESNDPNKDELDIIAPFIYDENSKFYVESWRTIYGSLDWFELLDSNGIFKNIMESDTDYLINKVMWIFFGILKKTDKVVDLIEPYVDKSPEWNKRIINTFIWSDLSIFKYFKLVLRLLDEGIFEKVYENKDYWNDINHRMINKLDETHPERYIDIISHYLNRKIKLTVDSGETNPFAYDLDYIPNDTFNFNDFKNLAKISPKKFINKILPIMLFLINLNTNKNSEKPFKDGIWGFRSHIGRRYSADDIILDSMEIALANLAIIDQKAFEKWENLLKDSDFETMHYLLVRAYALNGSKFSRKAVNYLCNNPKSLEIRGFNGRAGASMSLIKHISPHCTYFELKRLERLLLNYFNHNSAFYKWVCTFHPEECIDFYHYENRKANIQLNIMKSIPESLRSMELRSRIEEISHIFGSSYAESIRLETITSKSPISEEDARQYNDEEWLNAISPYNEDNPFEPGALELSRLLEKLVKDDPGRFSKLILKFPDDTCTYYFNAVLRGIADSDADLNSTIDVCKHCHNLPSRPCGRWITQPIANFANEKLPGEILEIVSWYAINDPDPSEELWDSNNSRGMVYYGGDIHDAGLNSVRGMVAESIGKMIYYNKDLIYYFLPTLNEMVNDSSTAVRSRVARTLIMILKYDDHLALKLFKKLVNTDDILLKTPYVTQFIYYNLRNNFEDISFIINRMLLSENSDVNEVGAIAASYASLIFEDKLPQLDFSLYMSEIHRLGVAKAFADYLPYASSPLLVTNILSKLFDDPSENVRNATYRCFRRINNDNIDEYVDLIRSFIYNNHSTSFRDLSYTLKDIIELPDITIEFCEQFFKITGLEASNIQTESSGTAGIIAQLIFRIYSQTENKEINKRCLDLIDYMLEIDVFGIEKQISEFMNDSFN